MMIRGGSGDDDGCGDGGGQEDDASDEIFLMIKQGGKVTLSNLDFKCGPHR